MMFRILLALALIALVSCGEEDEKKKEKNEPSNPSLGPGVVSLSGIAAPAGEGESVEASVSSVSPNESTPSLSHNASRPAGPSVTRKPGPQNNPFGDFGDFGIPGIGSETPVPATAPAGGTASGGAQAGGSTSGGAQAGGTASGGAQAGGSTSGGAQAGGTASGGAQAGGTKPEGISTKPFGFGDSTQVLPNVQVVDGKIVQGQGEKRIVGGNILRGIGSPLIHLIGTGQTGLQCQYYCTTPGGKPYCCNQP